LILQMDGQAIANGVESRRLFANQALEGFACERVTLGLEVHRERTEARERLEQDLEGIRERCDPRFDLRERCGTEAPRLRLLEPSRLDREGMEIVGRRKVEHHRGLPDALQRSCPTPARTTRAQITAFGLVHLDGPPART